MSAVHEPSFCLGLNDERLPRVGKDQTHRGSGLGAGRRQEALDAKNPVLAESTSGSHSSNWTIIELHAFTTSGCVVLDGLTEDVQGNIEKKNKDKLQSSNAGEDDVRSDQDRRGEDERAPPPSLRFVRPSRAWLCRPPPECKGPSRCSAAYKPGGEVDVIANCVKSDGPESEDGQHESKLHDVVNSPCSDCWAGLGVGIDRGDEPCEARK